MTRTISILGSTGSIGRQTLDVVDLMGVRVAALTCGTQIDLLAQQCIKYRPSLAVVATRQLAEQLRTMVDLPSMNIMWGSEGLKYAASIEAADTVITAVVGMMGLEPTLAACRAGKRIGLANKETLVCGGELVMAEARAHGAEIIPVDSEHSAIFQCLMGCRDHSQVSRLILTASGGAFYGMDRSSLRCAKKGDALKHPNWKMGPKITIDCATLLNKGLEFIEAMRLYEMPADKISVVVHRQSIIHSLVEFRDGAVMAQLGTPDMRIPIQLALTYPDRLPSPAPALDLLSCGPLTFAEPDYEQFPCLKMAMDAARAGGSACVVLNGANEAAVAAYLRDEIGFYDISDSIAYALDQIPQQNNLTLDDILSVDQLARNMAASYFAKLER